MTSPKIGFRFHASDEELEEIEQDASSEKNFREPKPNSGLVSSDSLESSKSEDDKSEAIGDPVKDSWNLLGKRSSSIDSNYESPFSNPIETWRKLNELKGKFTKTVEEKFSELKIDRNVMSKSSCSKLLNNKHNSSVSDSEDNSESSKFLEQWKDVEEFNMLTRKFSSRVLDIPASESSNNLKENLENETTIRRRKNVEFGEIIVATAGSENKNTQKIIPEEIESGEEAQESLKVNGTEDPDDFSVFEKSIIPSDEESQTPPSDENNFSARILDEFIDVIGSQTTVIVLGLLLFLFLFLPVPGFCKGFVSCLYLFYLWHIVMSFLKMDNNSIHKNDSFIVPDYSTLPALKVPFRKEVPGIWINEYPFDSYDPDYYTINSTISAYMEINNNFLKISRPKQKINKRATYDEPEYKLFFMNERLYNISGCEIVLLPLGLANKRLFSKKYPIAIFLKPDSLVSEKKRRKEDEKESLSETVSLTTDPELGKGKTTLYLFARCDRQKEDCYRKLLHASRLPNLEVTKDASEGESETVEDQSTKSSFTPNEQISRDEQNLIEECHKYMSTFVDCPKVNTIESDDLEQCEIKDLIQVPTQIQWFNALINRILFDIFRSPYWLSKIHEKLTRKLNSIRLPFYIEDIEIIEMDLGKSGPTFHRVSAPHIDDMGLWWDMDLTFNGYIRLTIQTRVNLVKLQSGVDETPTEPAPPAAPTEKPEKGKKKKEKIVFQPKDSKDNILKEDGKKLERKKEKKREEMDEENPEKKSEEKFERKSEEKDEKKSFKRLSIKVPDDSHRSSKIFKRRKSSAASSALDMQENSEKILLKVDEWTKVIEKDLTEDSRSAIYDSELEDSAESSDEEEEREISTTQPVHTTEEENLVFSPRRYPRNRKSSKKFFRVFENVAQSKYFKSMTQSKYVQRAIAGFSATDLKLTIEIKSCTGTLAFNIPPPPSDRMWIGFRTMPKIILSAYPKIGEKSVRFGQIKSFIQKKILHELKKIFVYPNMVDMVIPTHINMPPSDSSTVPSTSTERNSRT